MPEPSAHLPAGPFAPGQSEPTYFVLYADDCLLHFTEQELTAKQREDHEANIVLTAMLQVALTYMGRSKDHAALHDTFLQQPWADTLSFYHAIFSELFEDVIPPSNYHYFPRNGFYEAVAEQSTPGNLLSLYMVSGSNLALHRSPQAWELSRRVNSKMHFAATAPTAGIPVPETLVCTKATLAAEGPGFFASNPGGVMIKVQGLAGSRNVAEVASLAEAVDYVSTYDHSIDVLLQHKLDADQYVEMTVDLTVADDSIVITNVRKILFAEGLWVGNYISDSLSLSDTQREVCLKVGRYVRDLGYSAPQGLNCGIDFFVRGDDIVVIEINARWTGGLFPTQLIKRLGAEREHSVAFIDVLGTQALADYRRFLSANVSEANLASNGFRIVPMGFSPFPFAQTEPTTQTIDAEAQIYVWQVVIGDFEAFKASKNVALGNTQLPTADLITV